MQLILNHTDRNTELLHRRFFSEPPRPDISWRHWRRLPPCPLVIALVPLKCSSKIYNFLIGCPFPRRICLGALALKNEAYRPGHHNSKKRFIHMYMVLQQTLLDSVSTRLSLKSYSCTGYYKYYNTNLTRLYCHQFFNEILLDRVLYSKVTH